jgi:hypothetical protein
MESAHDFALRRTFQPYAALTIIVSLVSVVILFAVIKSGDLSGLLAIAFLWVIGIWSQYANTRYRIFWEQGKVKQVAAYGDITIIDPSEIKKIALERSDLQTLFAMRRPSRRIAIYARGSEGHKWIDVSLKHFAGDDIRRLMHAIHERRPDLSIPKNWA